ncbi:MAG: iron-sulfur cluster assembly scaffold protein [Deltaproteobacteria bacterium]|nr:iron-sulfur cluster assembly scaffold protein [Deltaproteobacteria bacterium]
MAREDEDWRRLYEQDREPDIEDSQAGVIFYNDTVIEHFTNPCNVGEIDDADGFALIGDPSCGDQMKLWIKVEAGHIIDIKFKSFGCPGAIATSSMATTLAMGMHLDDARQLTDDDVVRALGGIPANKQHCSLMGISALQAAIRDYEQRIVQRP